MDKIVATPSDGAQRRAGDLPDYTVRAAALHELRVLPAPVVDVWSGNPDTDRAWR